MNEIKPKKERRFLKTLGRVGEILVEQVLLKLGSSIIKKIGGKKTLPSILFIFLSLSLFAQFPNTGNKQRLGFQTTADGLTWRGSISDTASIQPINNQSAWVILDTINLKFYTFDFTSNVWNLVGGAQGLTMPFDSITFNTAKDGTVGVGEVEYNDTQGGLIQGLKGGNVTNVIGQQLHQRVNNRTGAPLTKGDVVYLAGSQGNRITVAKGLAVSDAFSANTFGVVAESIADNQSGFIITEGLITGLNTSALTEDSAVYLSPTVAGALTSTKPQAPQHSVYIGVCVKSNNGSGELFVKIRNGQELDELHDVRISNPINNASLYYKLSEKLWRDTTAALLVSDTASMLTNYLRTGTAALTYLPLTGGTTSGLITSSFNNSSNYSSGNIDNNGFQIYNTTSSTNNIYGGIQFFLGAAGGVIPGGEGLAQIYALRKGGVSDASTDLLFALKGVGGTLEKMRIKYDGKVGIGTSTPSYLLDVNGQIGSTGFIKSGGTSSQFLKADGSVDANTYLTTGTAASTYLPLTGGTLSGSILNSWTSAYSSAPRNDGAVRRTYTQNLYSSAGNTTDRVIHYYTFSQDECCRSAPVTHYYGRFNGFYAQDYPSSTPNIIYDAQIYYNNPNQFFYRAFSESENKTTWSIKPNNSGSSILNTRADMYLSGNEIIDGTSSIGGTLGVTGATTLSAPLTVNSSAVFNEGSTDSDFRVESDGNAHMVFVDASTDRVGIGTNTPDKTLHVNGEVKIATVTATPTALLGKDGSNVVGEVTTVAQTGLMTRGETTATTGSPSATFTVTHGLGSTPTSVLVTSAGLAGAEKIIFEVYTKNSTTFSVQAWNYDGTEASNKSVKIFWLAIK